MLTGHPHTRELEILRPDAGLDSPGLRYYLPDHRDQVTAVRAVRRLGTNFDNL